MSTNLVVREDLETRKPWALACLGTLVNSGRSQGWLEGPHIDGVPDPDELYIPAVGSALQHAAARLELSQTEIDLLWVLACVESDPTIATACSALSASGMLTVQLVDALVSIMGSNEDGHIERLADLGLIETTFDRRVPHSQRPVRATDRVIELVRGRVALPADLRRIARFSSATSIAAGALDVDVPSEVACAIVRANTFVVATGPEGVGRATMLRRAAVTAGLAILEVDCSRLDSDVENLVRQARRLAREARILDAVPLLVELDELSGEQVEIIERELVSAVPTAVLATARETQPWETRRAVIVAAVELPDQTRREALWSYALPGTDHGVILECARRYTLTPAAIANAASAVIARAGSTIAITANDVHKALRVQMEHQLTGLARRVEVTQTWDSMVLPVEQQDVLLEVIGRVLRGGHVFETWGFGDKIGRGLGTSVLMSGPPGTGKTMIAGLIAAELGRDLYQVDLSRVVSKYIGETEKQLAKLFDAAESGHAILLFDEADALFGKRTEVKSSNDRFANLATNYLLQRMEQFTGISILTTNHERAIDPALQRRLAFHIRVPMPDESERARIWRALIPAAADCEPNLDVTSIATTFKMSGGYIKNAVIRAAFLASIEGRPISTEHLARAARLEYESVGKVVFGSAVTPRK